MRAFDELAAADRHHIEKGSKAEAAEQQLPADLEADQPLLGIQEEFERVVAGFAVDIDGGREIRCFGVIEPPIIGEPAVGLRQSDELTRARMIKPERALALFVEDAGDAGGALQQGFDLGRIRPVLQIDVSDLMVG